MLVAEAHEAPPLAAVILGATHPNKLELEGALEPRRAAHDGRDNTVTQLKASNDN